LPLEVSHEYTAYGTAANNTLNRTNIVSLEGDNTPTVLSVTQYTNFTKAFFTFKTSHGSTVQAYCDVNDARKKSTNPFAKNSDAEFYENPTNDIADVPMSRTDGQGPLLCKEGLRRTSTMRRHQLPFRNPRSQLPTLWTAYRSQGPSCTV
jgi:hypothetical protein